MTYTVKILAWTVFYLAVGLAARWAIYRAEGRNRR